jgi:hypothetical protein
LMVDVLIAFELPAAPCPVYMCGGGAMFNTFTFNVQ